MLPISQAMLIHFNFFFLFFSFGWHRWRLPVLNYTASTKRIQKMKHICLHDCHHSVPEANCTESSTRLAFQLRGSQEFVVQVASLAEPKDSMLSIREADTCYPLGVSALYSIRLKCQYSLPVRYHQLSLFLLLKWQTGIRTKLTMLKSTWWMWI